MTGINPAVTALANSKWVPCWGLAGASDELGAYAAPTPCTVVINGELYFSGGYGKSFGFQGALGTYPSDRASGIGYRPELNGIFKVKADHTVERVSTFPDGVRLVSGVCEHPKGSGTLAYDADQWANLGDGRLGAPRNGWLLYYATPRSIGPALVYFGNEGARHALVHNEEEPRFKRFAFCIQTPVGTLDRRGNQAPFPGKTIHFAFIDNDAAPLNGDYYYSIIGIHEETDGSVWIAAVDILSPGGTKLRYMKFNRSPFAPYGDDARAPDVFYDVPVNRSNDDDSSPYMEDPENFWFFDVGLDTGRFAPYPRILRTNKATGVTTVEFTADDTFYSRLTVGDGLNRGLARPGFLSFGGKLYTQGYYSILLERQSDGSWKFEKETPRFLNYVTGGLNDLNAGVAGSELNFDFLRLLGVVGDTIYALCVDNADMTTATGYTFDANKKITKGLTDPGSRGYLVYLAYVGPAGGGEAPIAEGPSDGPYQPPRAAKHGPNVGDLAFRRST